MGSEDPLHRAEFAQLVNIWPSRRRSGHPCDSISPMSDEIHSLSDVLASTDRRLSAGLTAAAGVTPTGFHPLDTYLGGGLRAGELTLLGGPQGLGKTSLLLQMLQHNGSTGRGGGYFSSAH